MNDVGNVPEQCRSACAPLRCNCSMKNQQILLLRDCFFTTPLFLTDQNADRVQLPNDPFIRLLIGHTDHVDMKPAGEIAKLACLTCLHLLHKLLRVIARCNIQLRAQLPVNRVLHNHVDYRSAVIRYGVKFIQDPFGIMPAQNHFRLLCRILFHIVALPRRNNLIAVGAQQRNIRNDYLARNAKKPR